MPRDAAKATLNRDKATRLKTEWGVDAAQVRYREIGNWYATLSRFPAALFDAHGYVLFETEDDYRTSPYLQIGKELSVPKGISTLPGYVRVVGSETSSSPTVDIPSSEEKLEDEFHQVLVDNYTRAGREAGYWAHYFLRELRKKGGLATAQRMLVPSKSNNISKGLQALLDVGRTDLSVEYTVLLPRFKTLFTDSELAEAQSLLNALPDFTHFKPTEPEANFPDEVEDDAEFTEGAARSVTVNAYERNPAAREACISKYGRRCAVCDMSFDERYGPDIARGFIHVHHKKPMAMRRAEYHIRPTIDLVPVCPNCHAMLHSRKDRPLGIEELRTIMQAQKLT